MFSVRRVDQLIRNHPSVVGIAQEVFGLPGAFPGLSWVLEPTDEIQRRFWREHGDNIPLRHPVSVAAGWVDASEVVDARGQAIPGLEGLTGGVALFFIDENPLANWGHDCRYVAYPQAGGPSRQAKHRFPPGKALRLVLLASREKA